MTKINKMIVTFDDGYEGVITRAKDVKNIFDVDWFKDGKRAEDPATLTVSELEHFLTTYIKEGLP